MDVAHGPRLGRELNALCFELGGLGVKVGGSPPADMIDGVALARSGVAFLRENPDIAILHRINASFQLRKLAAEHVEVPVEASLGVRHSQMNVVEAKGFGILQDLDFSAPGVF